MKDWKTLKDGEPLLAYATLVEELRSRGIVRSSSNPVADSTEFLVARPWSHASWLVRRAGYDAKDTSEVRY